MPEQHKMVVMWQGSAELGAALCNAAQTLGYHVEVISNEDEMHLKIECLDNDLQALRDAVDALLVKLSEVEEAFNG